MDKTCALAPPSAAPRRASRAPTLCSTSPGSTCMPTRYGLGGLPSTAMSAAPPPLWRPATTPTRAKRLPGTASGAAADVTATALGTPSSTPNACASGAGTAGGAAAAAGGKGRCVRRRPQ